MNIPEIERLITEAVCNRPKVTTAPLNLYLYDSKLFCGGRIVMPKDAKFVSYVPNNCLEKGFNEQEWKLIVQKINQITNNLYDDDNKPKETSNKKQINKQATFNERRREQRLYYRRPMWYFQNLNKARHKGRMVDISSNGMGFTCSATSKSSLTARQTISTRLDVPLFCKDGSYDMVRFDREGQICRVEKVNNSTHRVALQFSQALPFKPAEQGLSNSIMEKTLATLT